MTLVNSAPSSRPPSVAADPPRGPEAEPTGLARIKDPELRAAVKRAYRGWKSREEWATQ